MRCLLVDDDEMSRLVLTRYVEQTQGLGLAGVCVDAVQAANVVRGERIDLLFLDVEMPEMTGLELLRGMDTVPEVLLVSGSREHAVEAFEADTTDYLVKPVTYARFLAAVERAGDAERQLRLASLPDRYSCG